MGWLRNIWRRVQRVIRADAIHEEIDEEMRFHVEMRAAENVKQGMSPREALKDAEQRFGRLTRLKELGYDVRGGRWLESIWQDIRFGVRSLRKNPAFTIAAALTLALGIGANTAILSTVNGLLLRPLPVENPDELISPFWGSDKDPEVWGGFSYANYLDLREQNQSLAGLLAWTMTSAGISSGTDSDGSHADVIWGELVSANYFDVLRVKPVLGRGFLPEEERTQNSHPVTVISYSLWEQRFAGNPGVIGQTVYLDGAPFTIVGVAPPSFKGLKFAFHQAFWVPLMMSAKLGTVGDWETERGWARFNVLGRLKPGVTRTQAEADLDRIAHLLGQQFPKNDADSKIQVVSEQDGRFTDITKVFRLGSFFSLCVAGLVMLLACANVANLILARSAAHAKEIGIRLALGAGRWRIVQQMLVESLLLAILGGVLGWWFAWLGSYLIHSSIPPIPYPIELNVSPDLSVLKWMAAIAIATGLIVGQVPALMASRPDLVKVIKSGVSGIQQRRWNFRNGLVSAQVAISIIALICAGLFLRSLNKALNRDPGFSVDNLVTMKLDPGLLAYTENEGLRFYADSMRKVAGIPGVRSVSLAEFLPLGDSNDSVGPVMKEGEPEPLPNQGISVSVNRVAPGYFETVKTPIVLGREFTEHDSSEAPQVAIVNQEFARMFYGSDENALGKRFRFWNSSAPLREIVGIAKNGLYLNLYEDPRTCLYVPESQQYQSGMMLLVSTHSSADIRAVAENARREIAHLDARMPVTGVTLDNANLSYAYWGPRLMAGLASALGLLSLLLATMGLYSVMTYTVAQRTRELGIRMALGAKTGDVRRLVIWQGMRLVAVGIAIGLLCALTLTRFLASLLLGIGAADPITFSGMAILLIAVTILACFFPARRATKVDPLVALRYE